MYNFSGTLQIQKEVRSTFEEYIDEKTLEMPEKDYIDTVKVYEDMINLEDAITMQGQMCVYLEAEVNSPKAQKAWFIVGNTDGFKMLLNGEEILSKDEKRIYTHITISALQI